MARRLRPVGLDFVETAPLRLVFAREVAASPEAVFHALAEDVSGWSEWFSAVTLARPTQDGAGREVRLRGGTRFEETVLAARAPEVYAYRVDVTNAPRARALVEVAADAGREGHPRPVDLRHRRRRTLPAGPEARAGGPGPRLPRRGDGAGPSAGLHSRLTQQPTRARITYAGRHRRRTPDVMDA